MTTTNLETHRLSLSIRAFVAVIVAVAGIVSSCFYASDKINRSIEQTNSKIEQTNMLLQSNRYKDSTERALIQLQVDALRKEFEKDKK